MRDVVDDWYTCYFALYRSARYLEARLKELEMYRQKKDSDVLAQAWKDTLKELEDTRNLIEYMGQGTSRCVIE